MEHIKEILEKRMRQNGIDRGVSTAQIIRAVRIFVGKLVSERVEKNIRSIHYAKGVFSFRVSGAIIGQEIKIHEQEILDRMRQDFPSETFRGIRILQR